MTVPHISREYCKLDICVHMLSSLSLSCSCCAYKDSPWTAAAAYGTCALLADSGAIGGWQVFSISVLELLTLLFGAMLLCFMRSEETQGADISGGCGSRIGCVAVAQQWQCQVQHMLRLS